MQHWIGNFLKMKWRYLLLMQYILSFGECVKTLTLEERSNATLNCTSPDVSISWTFNGMPAPFSQTLEPCEDGSGNDWMSTNDSETCIQFSYLHLLNFQVCHQGIYKCVGNSSNATDTTYDEYNITMSQNFSVNDSISFITLRVNQSAVLNCTAKRNMPASISWDYNQNVAPNITHSDSSRDGYYIATSLLTIDKVQTSNSGQYLCQIESNSGACDINSTMSFIITVNVPATITTYPSPQTVTSPSVATFACVASGLPRPNITWTDPDGNTLVSGNNNVNIVTTTASYETNNDTLSSTLTLYMTTAYISGLYSCAVDNGINGGDVTSIGANLTVYVVPNITSYLPAGSSRYAVNVTDDIIFWCTATGVPPPDIQWYRGNVLLNSSTDRVTVRTLSVAVPERALATVTRKLTLSQTSTSDASSDYSCRATNDGGQDFEEFELFIQVTNQVGTTSASSTLTVFGDTDVSLQMVVLSAVGGFSLVLILAILIIAAVAVSIHKKTSKKFQNGREMIKLMKMSKSSLSYLPLGEGLEARQPIALQFLSAHVESMHQNENCGFIEEYRIINENSPSKASDICCLDDNTHKNRYVNIMSFDETRVTLKCEEDNKNYINANFIKGYNHPQEYIASQGPLPCTLSDFWRMVWEYDVPTVVMLTNLVEKMNIKCSQYWPGSGTAFYDDFEVTLVNETSQADFVIRDLKINFEGDETTKEVKQFHFISWPDFGVPRHATPLLYFLRRIRNYHKYSDSRPMVFHCSAGVGRTGTLITIDMELQRAEKESLVDPFNSVLKLREQRNFMVQAEAQYVFLHDAILEGSQSGKKEVFASELRKKMEELEEKSDENESGYKQEFMLLRQVKVDVREFSEASEDTNKFKNRVTNALPFNHNRIVLNKKPGISGSDYINASFVDGYSKKAAYIATQGPLPNTVDDFWRMIWEKSVTTVVMLTQLVEREKCACYWPKNEGDTLQLSDFTVKLVGENNYGDYSTRELTVVEKMTEKCGTVQQFQFMGWPEIGAPVSGAGMVDLVDQVIRRQQHTGDKPIVVHCSAGIGRTGAFCCLNIAIERVQSEGTVDIFHTIKHLRTQRAHMIQNEAQYIFCYRALLDYVESLENYSNLK